jgi:hypothetical protein
VRRVPDWDEPTSELQDRAPHSQDRSTIPRLFQFLEDLGQELRSPENKQKLNGKQIIHCSGDPYLLNLQRNVSWFNTAACMSQATSPWSFIMCALMYTIETADANPGCRWEYASAFPILLTAT